MNLRVDGRAIKEAVYMLQYAIDKNHPGGFSIMFNTVRRLLDEKNKSVIVIDLARICSRHASMLAVLEGVLKDLIADGFNIQREDLQKFGVQNAKVLQILLDNGLTFTADDVKAAVGWYKVSGKTLKMLCKVCPEAQREIAQPLLNEYFCDHDCNRTKGELACEILDPDEAAVLMGEALAKAFANIEKRHADEVLAYSRIYSGKALHDILVSHDIHSRGQKVDLANRLHKLVNQIPNWKKCRDEIIKNTTDQQVAALLAAELEGES